MLLFMHLTVVRVIFATAWPSWLILNLRSSVILRLFLFVPRRSAVQSVVFPAVLTKFGYSSWIVAPYSLSIINAIPFLQTISPLSPPASLQVTPNVASSPDFLSCLFLHLLLFLKPDWLLQHICHLVPFWEWPVDTYTQYTVIFLRLRFPSLLMKMSFEILSVTLQSKYRTSPVLPLFKDLPMDTCFLFDFKKLTCILDWPFICTWHSKQRRNTHVAFTGRDGAAGRVAS